MYNINKYYIIINKIILVIKGVVKLLFKKHIFYHFLNYYKYT